MSSTENYDDVPINGITSGPEGDVWFTTDSAIGRVTPLRCGLAIGASTARNGADLSDVPRVRVMYPFHRLAGQEFEFVKRRRNWQADRVHFYDRGGALVALPAEWTDAVAADPFVVVSAGRSPLHVGGLLELSELVPGLAAGRTGRRRVKRTMP